MTGDVVDLAAKRAEHKPAPRDGEGLYQHGRLLGPAGTFVPAARHYPMTCICAAPGCGKTIDRRTPDEPWEHRW